MRITGYRREGHMIIDLVAVEMTNIAIEILHTFYALRSLGIAFAAIVKVRVG